LSDAGADRYVHLASDAMHLLAASAWVGALPGLAYVLRYAGDVARPERFSLAVSATQRFSASGTISVSALVMTGLINAWYLVGSVPALWGTEYGRLLLWKLLIFATMLVLAGDQSPASDPTAPDGNDDSHAKPQCAGPAAA
jgi:putative copper resistance protein D